MSFGKTAGYPVRVGEGMCRICESKPVTGIHYGVPSCEGCKAFYRRTVTKKLLYRCAPDCKFDNESVVCPFARCQTCRFQKCVFAGMDLKASIRGRIPRRAKKADSVSSGTGSSPDIEGLLLPISYHAPPDCSVILPYNQLPEPPWLAPDLPRKFSIESLDDYLGYEFDYNVNVDKTVAAVNYALNTTFAEELATKFAFPALDFAEVDSCVTQQETANAVLQEMAIMARNSREFLQVLPGFDELGSENMQALIAEKWAEIWTVTHLNGWYDNDFHWIIGDQQIRYTAAHARSIMTPGYTDHYFRMIDMVQRLGLTDIELYVLLVVLVLQPETLEDCTDRKKFLRFLYTHYMDALLKLIQSRRGLDSTRVGKLRELLRKFRNVHRAERSYMLSIDSTKLPWRAANDTEAVELLMAQAAL